MKQPYRYFLVLLLLAAAPVLQASGVADVVKAQILIGKALEIAEKYHQMGTTPVVPEPIPDNSGHFLLPVNEDGELTEWAEKALSAQVGAAVGAKAGEKAGGTLAAKVPFGGLLAGSAKKKGKEMGAVAAIGGMDFIRSTTTQSFNNLDDYAVYLHFAQGGAADYEKAVAAASAVYPDLEGRFQPAIREAYRKAPPTP